MKAFVIAGSSLRRLVRDRVSMFFVVVLPAIIILLIGVAVFGASGSDRLAVGVADMSESSLGTSLVRSMSRAPLLDVETFDSPTDLAEEIRTQELEGGVVVPADFEDVASGDVAEVTFLTTPGNTRSVAVRSAVQAAVLEEGKVIRAASFATQETGGTFDDNFRLAASLARSTQGVRVETEAISPGRTSVPGGFSYPAASNLVLFIFITSLAASGDLVQARRLGLSRRMLATPTSARTVLLGHGLGRFYIALFQGLFIFTLGAVVFGVEWGNLLATGVLIVAFSLVATGAAVLIGSLLRTEEQATALGPPVGIALGMLGGCMWPLEVVSPAMNTVGHVTPHAWTMDAFIDLIGGGADLGDIWPSVAVLCGFAAVFLAIATGRLRAALIP